MNKKLITLSIATAISLGAFAQLKPVVKNNNAVKFSKAINDQDAYKHLSIIASDEFEGRETGTKGAWMAADYIRDYYKSIGLKAPVNGSYFQPVGLVSQNITESILTINGSPKQAYKDFFIANASVSLKGLTFHADDIIFAGFGVNENGYNDFENLNVEGKVVMIFQDGNPLVSNDKPLSRRDLFMARMKKTAYLTQNKAKAVILIDPSLDVITPERAQSLQKGQVALKNKAYIERSAKANPFPSVSISVATANEILKAANTTVEAVTKQITETKKPASAVLNVALSVSAVKTETDVRGENVLGLVEGSDPKLKDEVIVVTGHYDHIGITPEVEGPDKINNGADDDGSGTTGVMLMAKAFMDAKKAGKGPKRSILFMAVVGEEKGLWGSDWYSENPVFPIKNTIANLNIDMIGRIGEVYLNSPDSTNYIYSVGSNMLSSGLGKLSEQVNNVYTKMKFDYKYDDPKDTNRIYYRSDHYNFAKLGIPVIFYYDGMLEQDYHAPGDEVEKINFPLLTKRAKQIYYTAWELANQNGRPVVDMDGAGNPKK